MAVRSIRRIATILWKNIDVDDTIEDSVINSCSVMKVQQTGKKRTGGGNHGGLQNIDY